MSDNCPNCERTLGSAELPCYECDKDWTDRYLLAGEIVPRIERCFVCGSPLDPDSYCENPGCSDA